MFLLFLLIQYQMN